MGKHELQVIQGVSLVVECLERGQKTHSCLGRINQELPLIEDHPFGNPEKDLLLKVIVLETGMEEQTKLTVAGVSFRPQAKSLSNYGQSQKMLSTRADQTQDKILPNNFKHSVDVTTSPNNAMEFLCRSWSPSASDFLQIFPKDLLLPMNNADKITKHEEQLEETQMNAVGRSRAVNIREHKMNMDLNHKKGWLGGQSLSSFLMSRKKKKKEELRLHTANLHATLSLTQLAAAITGFVTYSVKADSIKHMNHEGIGACNQDMGSVVASAAALMTTVCAEAAEYIGASRSQVASAINSGLATHTPIDMIALTATSATCLRGAAILKSRDMADYFTRIQDMLKIGGQLYVITPSGHRGYTWVTLRSKHKMPILSLKKKYLRGVLTATKEYEIMCIEEGMEGESFFLNLKTSNGTIKLLLEDEKKFSIWISVVSSLLKDTSLADKEAHLLCSSDHIF